jgi:predicted acyltransferase
VAVPDALSPIHFPEKSGPTTVAAGKVVGGRAAGVVFRAVGPSSPGRLLSLDVFRGATVAAMVLVNNPGSWAAVHAPLRHADWHGWTPTDLVFPFFLFIVGAAIPLALGPRLARGEPRSVLLRRIVRRAALIFTLGLFLHAFPGFDLTTIRIPGVLQRIAICYLLAAVLFAAAGWRIQAGVGVAVLLGYWAVLMLVPVPGFGAGDLSKEGNLAGFIDRAVLGPHIWRVSRVYDPEGLLSTIPALGTTLAGVLAGHWLRAAGDPRRAVAGLAAAGAAATAAGLVWGVWFPINKPLWTSSYALFTAGLALVALAACHWVIEVRGRRGWTPPFVAFGVNALALFFLSTLVARLLAVVKVAAGGERVVTLQMVVFERVFAPLASPVNASLAYAVATVLAWLAVMWVLYRKDVRLTV